MNGNEVLRIVDAIHRDKNIEKEIVFDGIEQAIISAARKYFGEEADVVVSIDRESGEPSVKVDGEDLEADEIGELLGRIAAQTAKQVMIQKIREAERDSLYDEYTVQRTQIVNGTISRIDKGTCTVNLGKVEGILPRGEQIPGEVHRTGERIRAIVLEVRKAGSRVKIILSRTHPDLVRRLFELEIPEVAEHVIEVRSLAREAGYRSKVAVSCYDTKVDAVGACVGVRGSRIKNIVDELAGERIDIVRWNDSLQVLVPNALQPAEVEDVILCPMLGKVIVLVREDQLSLAIGKKGQNVRLASKLVGWDINVMTQERLDEQLDVSVEAFSAVPGIAEELAENLVSQGFFTFDDLSVIEPEQLAELGGLSAEECDSIIAYADAESLRLEEEEKRASEAARLRAQLEAAAAARGETETDEETSAESETPAEAPATGEPEPAGTEAEAAATEEQTETAESAATAEAEPADKTATETVTETATSETAETEPAETSPVAATRVESESTASETVAAEAEDETRPPAGTEPAAAGVSEDAAPAAGGSDENAAADAEPQTETGGDGTAESSDVVSRRSTPAESGEDAGPDGGESMSTAEASVEKD